MDVFEHVKAADALGREVAAEVATNKDGCDVAIADLEAIGLGLKTLAYADWLTKHGLRMLPPSNGLVCFVKAPEEVSYNDLPWCFVVENPNAVDPCEVRYRLALVDDHGNILKKDAIITNAEHGLYQRLRKAMERPLMMRQEPVPPPVRAVLFPKETT